MSEFTMKPEHIETAIAFVLRTMSGFDYFDTVSMKAFAALEADGEAMRQPITAETLVADGWEDKGGGTWWNEKYLHSIFEGRDFVWWLTIDLDNLRLPGMKTMYDLRELMRLLSSQAQTQEIQ